MSMKQVLAWQWREPDVHRRPGFNSTGMSKGQRSFDMLKAAAREGLGLPCIRRLPTSLWTTA